MRGVTSRKSKPRPVPFLLGFSMITTNRPHVLASLHRPTPQLPCSLSAVVPEAPPRLCPEQTQPLDCPFESCISVLFSHSTIMGPAQALISGQRPAFTCYFLTHIFLPFRSSCIPRPDSVSSCQFSLCLRIPYCVT